MKTDQESTPDDGICLICQRNLCRLGFNGQVLAYCMGCAGDMGTLHVGDLDPGFAEFLQTVMYGSTEPA